MSIKLDFDPDKKCIKCSKRKGFLYYCEDCGGTICNECIISEKTECTFCNECAHISVGSKCEKCGKTNTLSAAKKYLRRCPICSSMKIKDIPKKITGLTNEYTDAINLLYNGLDVIRNFATKFSIVVGQAKYLRRERFGLYPAIENNLIRIQGQFYEITQRASELANKAYQQIAQEARLLKFNQQVTVNKLPYIDRILKMIRTHAQSYINLLEDFLKDSEKDLDEVYELVNELNGYLKFFDEVTDKFEPEMLELKIAVIPNVKITFPERNHIQFGSLYITNKHLYFMRIHRFFFNLKGKVKAIPISLIRDVELKERRIFGSRLLVNIPDKKNMKIRANHEILDRLNFLFGVLFNDNEGYIISDPYLLEELRATLDHSILRERLEMRIKDLKQIPFSQIVPHQENIWEKGRIANLPQETEEVKQLRIKLRAARDTLKQLTKAFEDRTITPEIYFSRLEKTQEKIFYLEDQLKSAMRTSSGFQNTLSLMESLRSLR